MERDVVLDIFFAKAVSAEYMRGVDALVEGSRAIDSCERAVAARGLLREYANAVSKGDTDAAAEYSRAMVGFGKAFERFNYASGPRDVEVARDSRGRFSRYLANAKSNIEPKQPTEVLDHGHKGTRERNRIQAHLGGELAQQLRTDLQGGPNYATDPVGAERVRERAQQMAGRIRAINQFQDELIDLFGDGNKDVVVVIEGEQMGQLPPDQEIVELNEAVPKSAVNAAMGDAKMTMGLRPNADPKTREKFMMFQQLLDSGMRPDIAAELMSGQGGQGAAGKINDALMGYTGQKANTPAAKAKKHFDMADALGDYFIRSGSPQLAAAGAALKNTAKLGNRLSPEHYELAERMNYRFRGMKDRLPKRFSDSMNSAQHRAAEAMFEQPDLTPERWAQIREKVFSAPARQERSLSTDRSGNVKFSDVPLAIASHMDRSGKYTSKLSPRDYVDQFVNDVAVTSLIEELPTDMRAVELGQQAGFGVPSSGIIIRSDGRAKEMYRGVGEDHYLPFSAKALPELRDGQYVRTRVVGGLTGEDITTLVTSGARRATVVSGSGVFTLDLKPNTSLGGRMTSPEVAAMGERYERILDKLVDSKLYAVDLPAAKKAELRQAAIQYTDSMPGTPAFDDRYKTLVNQARAEASQLNEGDIEKVTEGIDAMLASESFGSPQMKAKVRDDLIREALEDKEKEKVRLLGLNAEGYALALETLRLQYPAIIDRVDHETLKEFVENRELGDVIDRASLSLRNRPNKRDDTSGGNYVEAGTTRRYEKKWRVDRQRPERVAQVMRTVEQAVETSEAPSAGSSGDAAASTTGPAGGGSAPSSGGAAAPQAGGGAQTPPAASASPPGAGATFDEIRGQMEKSNARAVKDARSRLSAAAQSVTVEQGRSGMAEEAAKGDAEAQGAWSKALRGDIKLTSYVIDEVGPLLIDKNAVENSVRSPEGLAGIMSAIYPRRGGALMGLRGLIDSDAATLSASNQDHLEIADSIKLSADLLASSALVQDGAGIDPAPTGKLDEFSPRFAVNPEYLAFVKKTFGSGQSGEQLANLEKVLNDKTRKDTKRRAAARDGVFKYLTAEDSDMKTLNHGGGLSTDPYEGMSVLGLLALQEIIRQEIDDADDASSSGGKLVEAIVGKDFSKVPKGDQAAMNSVKEKAYKAYQDAIGAEFARRTLGGGGVGPKVMAGNVVLSKEEETVQEFLRLLQEKPPVLLPL